MHDQRIQILILSEELAGTPDEGLKRFVGEFARALAATCDVQLAAQDYGEKRLARNRVLVGPATKALAHATRHVRGVFYFPRAAGATLGSLMRCQVLQQYFGSVPIALVALQQKHWSTVGLRALRLLWPRCVFLPTTREVNRASALGLRSALVLPGIDIERFKPVSDMERNELRWHWNIQSAKPVLLHVGHLKESRSLDTLVEVKRSLDCEVLVVGSTSTRREPDLVQRLIASGVKIITEYVPRIETVYQSADCYVFPVSRPDAAIAAPLSVLEAMACNLTVVSYPFGELGSMFAESSGLFYAHDSAGFVAKTREALRTHAETRERVLSLSWQSTAQRMLRELMTERCSRSVPVTE